MSECGPKPKPERQAVTDMTRGIGCWHRWDHGEPDRVPLDLGGTENTRCI